VFRKRLLIFLLTVSFLLAGCQLRGRLPQQPTLPPPSPVPPLPMTASPTASGPLADPFADTNMFFGLSLLKSPDDGVYAADLGVSWVSLQPLVI